MAESPTANPQVARLRRAVSEWLAGRRAVVAERARGHNIPASYPVQVPLAHATGAGLTFDSTTRSVTPFALWGLPYFGPLRDLVTGVIDIAGEALAQDLVRLFGHAVRYTNSVAPTMVQPLLERPEFLDPASVRAPAASNLDTTLLPWTPLESAVVLVYEALMRYLSAIASLEVDDTTLALSIADEMVAFASSSDMELTTRVLLACVDTSQPQMECGPYVLKHLSSEELGMLGTHQVSVLQIPPLWPQELPPPMSLEPIPNERIVLEVTARIPKASVFVQDPRAQKLVLALELLGHTPCGRGAVVVPRPAWAWRGTGFGIQLMTLPRWPKGSTTIAAEDFKEAVRLAELMPDGVVTNPQSHHDLALQRFALAVARQQASEALVDYVVALEALLLGDQAGPELQYRFALNGAIYLAESSDERLALYEDLRQLYSGRSKLVHGSVSYRNLDLNHLQGVAVRTARTGLMKALTTGWPNPVDFINQLLSDGRSAASDQPDDSPH